MKTIIELMGEPNSGKTTLAIVLGEELAKNSVLYLDASVDERLTEIMAPDKPAMTLAQWIQQSQRSNREAIDWAFHDLTISVGEEGELLAIGNLPDTLNPSDEERLRYGLTRLVDSYDYVIIDGFHPLLHRLLPEENIQTLMVLTPSHLAAWQLPIKLLRTPAILLNQANGEEFPASLEEAIRYGKARLIGKLPRYATADECIQKLPDAFKNCLLRLDIPLSFTHS